MPKIFRDDFLTRMGPSVPKIFRDDFFKRMGPSVAKIFRDDFFTRMGPSVPKIFRDDFFTRMGPSVRKIIRDDFFTRMGPSVPEILRGDVSPKWDHLCPKRKILHRATLSVHGEIILPVCCFPAFPQLFAFPYTYFHLTCSFLLPYRLSAKWDHLCPRYLEMIFFLGPSVPEILRGDVSREWDHLCPRYLEMTF